MADEETRAAAFRQSLLNRAVAEKARLRDLAGSQADRDQLAAEWEPRLAARLEAQLPCTEDIPWAS